jgi:chromate transporter
MSRLGEVARLFLWLGCTCFGGPAVHLARMQDETVRRGWETPDSFLGLVGAVNLLPGPNSTEVAMLLGLRRAGLPGLLVSGACFIAPGAGVSLGLGLLYASQGAGVFQALLHATAPVMLAVLLQALWGLAKGFGRDRARWLLAGAGGALLGLGVPAPAVLAALGLLSLARQQPAKAMWVMPLLATDGAGPTAWGVGAVFLKVGSILYGSGYVLLALLGDELVQQRGWLTERTLLDAISIGQLTPGPVFTTASFIGAVLVGPAGGAAATAGIFAPAFVLTAVSGPLLPRLQRSPGFRAFLDGVGTGALVLLAAAAVPVARAAALTPATALEGAAALALLLRGVNSTWLLLGSMALGLCLG